MNHPASGRLGSSLFSVESAKKFSIYFSDFAGWDPLAVEPSPCFRERTGLRAKFGRSRRWAVSNEPIFLASVKRRYKKTNTGIEIRQCRYLNFIAKRSVW
jgi:hypothetical protein